MNKKVLLLNLPFERPVLRDYGCPHGAKSDYLWPPVDLLFFGAAVRHDAEISYIDAIAGRMSARDVMDAIDVMRPAAVVVMLSSITFDSDISLIDKIRTRRPDIRIWASGDVIFFGDSEIRGIDYRIRDLTNKKDILEYWRNDPGGGIIRETSSPDFSIGICPHELTRKYSYAMPYSLYRGITCVNTNYGCPYSCTFCNSNKLGFKRRLPAEVIEELLLIQDIGIKEVLFRDFTFNMSDTNLICDEIIRNRISLKWSCWTSAALVDKDILRKMKAAGCYLISYGAESGDERVLKKALRPVGTEQLKRAVNITKAAGIEVLTSFILGFPDEDRAKTLSFMLDVDPDFLSLNILAPRLGTLIREELISPGKVDNTDSLLSSDDCLVKARNDMERSFFLRPGKLMHYLVLSLKSPYRLLIFIKNGTSLVRRWLNPGHIH